MLLFSFKIILEATCPSALPISHGRLLHGTFLNIIKKFDAPLSAELHDDQVKRFSVGILRSKIKLVRNSYNFQVGDIASWHITCAGEDIFQCFKNLQIGESLRVGRVEFIIKNFICDSDSDESTGFITMDTLKEVALSLPVMNKLELDFVTPTTFKYLGAEWPFPRQESIFGSLAEKWNAFSSTDSFDVEQIKELSGSFIPVKWHGETRMVNITKDRGVLGFVGSFTYSLELVPEEYRSLFILLAEFSQFTGVGRLNAQGMGRVQIKYE
ncbi:MAG: CRISPR system precrRNA processing endoribonuclease RAMP protein Cas6 [Phascolarctobacterium sp.]|nr:CRISPR system precrRNA processing endoribonuclease RAMP protein Cas6 [Phascolarctobacterium sp.]